MKGPSSSVHGNVHATACHHRRLPALADYRRAEGWVGREVRYYVEIGSTNDIALDAARAGAAAGLLVLAGAQTAGRGRLGRRWVAPPSTCLLMSILFRPPHPFAYHAARTTMVCGLALRDAVVAVTGVQAALKWPNDLIAEAADGGWWKLGGMLSEVGLSDSGEPEVLVVGMGLNVNVPSAELPGVAPNAGSLLALTGEEVDCTRLLDRALRSIEARYEAMLAGDDPLPAWRKALAWLGREVEVTHPLGRCVGVALGVDDDGALLVRSHEGPVLRFPVGDVSVRLGEARHRDSTNA